MHTYYLSNILWSLFPSLFACTQGWALLDANARTRGNVVKVFTELIQTQVLHPKYIAYASLYANDPEHSQRVMTAFSVAMKRLRITHEELCTKSLINERKGDKDANASAHAAELRLLAADNMPEGILPFVLYLLSHHPDFPMSSSLSEKGDEDRLSRIMSSIRMVLTVLRSSLRNASDNLSYLMKQVSVIAEHYRDR
jgi:hypothetical protein